MRVWGGGLAAALLAAGPAVARDGAEVTLSAREGPMAVTGRVLAYDGDTYRIDTAHGPLTLAAAAVACEGAACPDMPVFRLVGDPALTDVLVPALIEAFAARAGHRLSREGGAFVLAAGPRDAPERLRVEVVRSTSEAGLAALADGPAQAALSIRPPRAEGPQRVLALDALVPVVSPRNPLRALSPREVAALFAGEVADWGEVGGTPGPVSLHLPEGGAGAAFEALVMRPAGLALSADVTRHADAEAVSRAVAREPGAIGVTTLARAGPSEPLALRGACGLVSRPGADAVRAGDWPLTLPLTLALRPGPLPRLAREWVAFATSPAAERVVRRAGLLDPAPREIPMGRQGDRLAAAILAAQGPPGALRDAVADLQGLARLTPTFRFEGGTRLDAPSREAAARLARRIASGAFDGRTLVFVGFGDATGPPERTLALSRERAAAVLEAVRTRALPRRDRGPLLAARGHGAALAVACDDTAAGRRLNRRVELWTR